MRFWLALLFLAVLYLSRLGGYPLQDPDEGRYAEIPREMIESGDWVTPRLNYVKYFEKPPLLYWLVAAGFAALGPSELVARLVPALSALCCVALTFLLGQWLIGRRAAWIGATILATSPIFFAFSQGLVIDMLLALSVTAALVAFLGAHRATRKLPWVLAAATASALAVLAKGPVGLLLPGAVGVAFLAAARDATTARAMLSWRPIALFAVVVVPWFALVSMRNPEFAHFFFVHEHLQRFTSDVGHPAGPLYYLPVVLLGGLPWTAMACALPFSSEARAAFGRIPVEARLFLGLWAGIVIVFFSVASSKLAGYILPALPPLAVLAGGWFDELWASGVLRRALGVARGGVAAVAAVFLAAFLAGHVAAEAIAVPLRIDVADVTAVGNALAWGAAAVLLVLLGRRVLPGRLRDDVGIAFGTVAVGLALMLTAAVGGRGVVKTSRELARVANRHLSEGVELVAYGVLLQGLSFYTGRRVVQVANAGEIWHGAKHAPDRAAYFWPEPKLAAEWRARRLLVATTDDRMEKLLPLLDPPPVVLVRDQRFVLLARPEVERGGAAQPPAVAPSSCGGGPAVFPLVHCEDVAGSDCSTARSGRGPTGLPVRRARTRRGVGLLDGS